MAFSIKYRDGGMGVECLGSGIVSGEESLAVMKELFASKDQFRNLVYALIDVTLAT